MIWIGRSSKGRKGVAVGRVQRVVVRADEFWGERLQSGLSSGEGLIHAVRDSITKGTGDKLKVIDEGVTDKRLMVLEAEFASTLRVLGRDGNTLSPTLRNAWDSGRLQTMTKHSPSKASGAHISTLAHITANELQRYLTETEAANGFGNRHLFVCVARSKRLPFGGDLDPGALDDVVAGLRAAIDWAKRARPITWAQETRPIWEGMYEELSVGRPGLLGALTSRAEAQVVRLSVIYAALDSSDRILPEHLYAAVAVWEYCDASARYVFGDALGDPTADRILSALRDRPEGMMREAIRDVFHRHKTAKEIGAALERLRSLRLVTSEKVKTRGRTAERWRAVQ